MNKARRVLFAITLAFGACCANAQSVKPSCAMAPGGSVAVVTGGTQQFAVNCGAGPVTYRLVGPGTLDASGLYHAPVSVPVPAQVDGIQQTPINSVYTTPVDTMPVDPLWLSWWKPRIAEDHPTIGVYHSPKIYPELLGFYDNVVDSTTPQQVMNFAYADRSNGYQGTSFPIPLQRARLMEGGVSVDPYTWPGFPASPDRHQFTCNKDTGECTEIYNLYVDFKTVTFTPANPTGVCFTTNTIWPIPNNYPVQLIGATGGWSAANNSVYRMQMTSANCGTIPFNSAALGAPPAGMTLQSTIFGPLFNSQGGQKFHPDSYAQMGGVDAASMPIGALSVKLDAWYSALMSGAQDLGHAVRITMANYYLGCWSRWPAQGCANEQDPIDNCVSSNGATVCTVASDMDAYFFDPCDNYTYTPGCQFKLFIGGLPAPWNALNGMQTVTAIDDYHFSLPIDSSGFGPWQVVAGEYAASGFMGYGTTLRIPASFDVDGFCTESGQPEDPCVAAKIYVRTGKRFGYIVADGTTPGDNFDVGIISNPLHRKVLHDAANLIRTSTKLQPFENFLEAVDRSSQQTCATNDCWQRTNNNRVSVTACAANGCASTDVLLQGTTVGCDPARLLIAADTTYQLNCWARGNVNTALSFSIDTGIPGASVSAAGAVTMPFCGLKQRGLVKVSSAADATVPPHYVEVGCLPRSSDGSYRLALGNYSGDYLDSNGFTWFGSWNTEAFNSNLEQPGLWWASKNGSWQGYSACANDGWTGTDSQLYSRSTDANDDTRVEVVLPNGNYQLEQNGEAGFGGFGAGSTCPNSANLNVYDWEVQGQTLRTVDGYTQAGGNYRSYTLNAVASVRDQVFVVTGRQRVPSIYGASWSSLLIKPAAAAVKPPNLLQSISQGVTAGVKKAGGAVKTAATKTASAAKSVVTNK